MTDTAGMTTPEEQDEWTCEYDEDTGEHRIYEDGELIACVGNMDMEFNRQEELAEMIRSASKTPIRPEEQATLSKLEAETHVLVPVEPTEAMEDAHDMAHAEAETIFAGFPDLWRAMITAAQEGE